MKSVFHLRVNGKVVEVLAAVHKTFLEVLREDLQLTGTNHKKTMRVHVARALRQLASAAPRCCARLVTPPVWRGEHALFCWCLGQRNWWRISAVLH